MKLRSAADALPRRVLLTLCLGGFVESTSGWQSVFLNATNESWTRQTVALGGRDFRLDDYSYTGYALSEFEAGQDIPPTVYPISASSGDDITTVLQTTVSNAASGGHITIPAGTFVITSTVFVTTGNLSIEGPGSGMTTVRISSAYRPADLLNESPICFRGGSQTDISLWLRTNQAVALCAITSDIARGAFTVEVDSTNGFGAGDWVVLQQYFPQAFSLSNSGGAWPTQPTNTADYNLTFTYLRRTVSVSNSLITLDAPLPRGLRTTDQPIRMFKPAASNYLENVGIEALTILVETNTNSTGDFTGRPAGIGLSFINTFNGWARDVKILNVAKAGFQPTWSARISFRTASWKGPRTWVTAVMAMGSTISPARTPFIAGARGDISGTILPVRKRFPRW